VATLCLLILATLCHLWIGSVFLFLFIFGMDSAESPTKTQAGEDENYSLLCQAHEQFNK